MEVNITLFIQITILLLLLIILSNNLFKPFLSIFDKREAFLECIFKKTNILLLENESIVKFVDCAILKTQKEGILIFGKKKIEAENLYKTILFDFKKKALTMLSESKKTLIFENKQILSGLNSKLVDCSEQIFHRLIN